MNAMQGTVLGNGIRVLDMNELDEVNGAVGLPGAVVGAAMGAVAYGIDAGFSGSGSFTGFASAVGVGALTGFAAGPVSIVRTVWTFNATTFGNTTRNVMLKLSTE